MKDWRKTLFIAGIILVTAACTAGVIVVAPRLFLSNPFQAWATVKSLRARVSSTGGAGGTQEMALELVMPNKVHMITQDPSGKELEMYMIETEFYMKVGTKWTKMAMPAGVNFDFANPTKVAAAMGAQKDVKFAGAELLDGIPTFIYQYTSTTKAPTKVWIGVVDNLPHKSESEPKAGQKTTTTFYDYNASITIAAPI